VVTFVMVVTQSRSAWLAVLVVLAAVALRDQRWRSATLGAAAVLLLASIVAFLWPLSPEERLIRAQTVEVSAGHRLRVWRQGGALLATSPLTGIGLNEFRHVFDPAPGAASREIAHAHNFFLQTALDTGLVGLVAYVGLLVLVLRDALRPARAAGAPATVAGGAALALVGVHAFGLTDAIALGAKVGLFQWYAMGLAIAASRIVIARPTEAATTSA
jgi:O-antigen ligase